MDRECLLTYKRFSTLNVSGDLVMVCVVSGFCLLMEIFYLANARAYLMYILGVN